MVSNCCVLLAIREPQGSTRIKIRPVRFLKVDPEKKIKLSIFILEEKSPKKSCD